MRKQSGEQGLGSRSCADETWRMQNWAEGGGWGVLEEREGSEGATEENGESV